MRPVTDDQIDALPGWFEEYDVDLFRLLLVASSERLGGGDVAELGVYLGKSATLLGSYVAPAETLTVVDLFGGAATTSDNQDETTAQYSALERAAFEANFLAVHGELPNVVEGPSGTIVDHAAHGTHRFVHVDASHLHEHVRGDVEAARTLLKPDGVVVFDDYRSEHTPGVAAAVWAAVNDGLHPFALTPVKLYATFGHPAPWYEVVDAWATTSRWLHETQQIHGRPVCRIWWEPGVERPTPSFAARVRSTLRRLAG